MPTGYTAFIEDGDITSGKDFLMLCARAFGACVDMKDEPLSKPIPHELKPSTYYHERMVDCLRRRAEYERMSLEEAEAICEDKYLHEVKCREEFKREQQKLLERYNRVLDEVKSWVPPTDDHQGLKNFAIEQIEMCLPNPDLFDSTNPPHKWNGAEWINSMIEMCDEDIERFKKRQQEENERVSRRNQWISQLRESLA